MGGYQHVIEIGRDFRNEGISFKHNPSSPSSEWYEAYTDYNGVMRHVEALLAALAQELGRGITITYNGNEIDLAPPSSGASPSAMPSVRPPASTIRPTLTPSRWP